MPAKEQEHTHTNEIEYNTVTEDEVITDSNIAKEYIADYFENRISSQTTCSMQAHQNMKVGQKR